MFPGYGMATLIYNFTQFNFGHSNVFIIIL